MNLFVLSCQCIPSLNNSERVIRESLGNYIVQGCTQFGLGLPLQVHLLTPYLNLHHGPHWPICLTKASLPRVLAHVVCFAPTPPQVLCIFKVTDYMPFPQKALLWPSSLYSVSPLNFLLISPLLFHQNIYILSVRSYRRGFPWVCFFSSPAIEILESSLRSVGVPFHLTADW